MIAYFDTNVFGHLDQGEAGATADDVYCISRAVRLEYLKIVLSDLNIEETLPIVCRNQAMAVSRVKLIFALSDKNYFVRVKQSMVNEAIRAYATDTVALSPFETLSPKYEQFLRNIVEPDPEHMKALAEIIKQVNRELSKHHSFLTRTKYEMPNQLKHDGRKAHRFTTF